MEFSHLGLYTSLLKTIAKKGYVTPTPVQQKAIPPILQGRDVIAAAQTGTGKTASFVLPMIQRLAKGPVVDANRVLALILAPTRELAIQIDENIKAYSALVPTKSQVVFGGVKINPQMMALRSGVDILTATPGRLLDLHRSNAINFSQLQILIFDEADRMLDLGFADEIEEIIKLVPQKRQTLMFSATLSEDIRNLAKPLLNNPVEIAINPEIIKTEEVHHLVYPSGVKQKSKLLIHLIKKNDWNQILVFCKTRRSAQRLKAQLEEEKIDTAIIHGKKTQAARAEALHDFKSKMVKVLVATDLVARGLDIIELPYVVNFELPKKPEDYIHRIGRTGRAGIKGEAISLVSAIEFQNLVNIELFLNEIIPRVIEPGFEPENELPESSLLLESTIKKPKRPKKAVRLKLKALAEQADLNKRVEQNEKNDGAANKEFWKKKYKKPPA